MVDLVHFLTGGNQNTSADDHPVVKVTSRTPTSSTGKPWDMHTLFPCEMYDMNVKVGTCSQLDPLVNTTTPHGPSRVCELYAWKLMREHRTVPAWLISALDSSESMGSALSPNSTPAPPSHVQKADQPFGHHSDHGGAARAPHREEEDLQGSHALRSGKEHGNGPSGHPRQEHLGQLGKQPPRALDPLSGMRSQASVRPETIYNGAQPRDGQPGHGGTTTTSTWPHAHCPDLQGHGGQAGSRGETLGDDPQGQGSASLLHEQDKSSSSQAHQPQGDIKDCRRVHFSEPVHGEQSKLGETSDGHDGHLSVPLHGGADQAHGSGHRTSASSRGPILRGGGGTSRSSMIHPLPVSVGAKVMQMVIGVQALMTTELLNLNYGDRDVLWEFACAPQSWLSQAVQDHGMDAQRINLYNGFDLYKEETWVRLRQLRRARKPRKLWFSLPCTKWCRWTSLNYSTPEGKEKLEKDRRRERKMLRFARDFILESVDEIRDIDIYWEWPHPCYGWEQRPLQDLSAELGGRDIEWLHCRVDGCAYGMKDHLEENFLAKKWSIRTTDCDFHRYFHAKVCPNNHQHTYIQGIETSRSAYYPWRMVLAIARCWRDQLLPPRFHRWAHSKNGNHGAHLALELAAQEDGDPHALPAHPPSDPGQAPARPEPHAPPPDEPQPDPPANPHPPPDAPSPEEVQRWEAKLAHFHKAAGHPTNSNLVRLLQEAGHPRWRIDKAKEFKCSACEALRPGGLSSGQVPPAATYPLYQAWQAVGLDVSEWDVPGVPRKVKFALFIDLATKLRVVCPLMQYNFLEMKAENAEMLIKAFSERWLSDKPRPEVLIPDCGKTMTAKSMHDFCNSVGVQLAFSPEKESWAHGIVEAAIQDVKMTATAIQTSSPEQNPEVTLYLAAAALNSTEYTRGFSSFQWCFGKAYIITEEDIRTFEQLPQDQRHREFEQLVQARQKAEDIARSTRRGLYAPSNPWTWSRFGEESGLLNFIEERVKASRSLASPIGSARGV